MNLHAIDSGKVKDAQGRLESWFSGMKGPGGYYGPVVGFRGVCMGYCGPGFDWRYEGLMDGWLAHGRERHDPVWMERMEESLAEIARNRLANGVLRCSYFDSNPFEGGMPHEPILMAAVLRARAFLRAAGRPDIPECDALLARFVEERLTRELWNKALRTFNNWLQSEYETYAPFAVAAIVEVLIGYEAAAGQSPMLESMIKGAADSLLAVQIKTGALRGGVPVSNRRGASINPYLAARCLTAFELLRQRLGDQRFAQAGDDVEAFLRNVAMRDGGFPCMIHLHRPATPLPVFVGATAGVLTSLARSGRLTEEWVKPHLAFVLNQQTESGAFNTATGFGRRGEVARPDWRDMLPACGWADKVYHLLAVLNPGSLVLAPTGDVRRAVTIRGRPAVFEESVGGMRLTSPVDNVWFDWRKGTKWPLKSML